MINMNCFMIEVSDYSTQQHIERSYWNTIMINNLSPVFYTENRFDTCLNLVAEKTVQLNGKNYIRGDVKMRRGVYSKVGSGPQSQTNPMDDLFVEKYLDKWWRIVAREREDLKWKANIGWD